LTEFPFIKSFYHMIFNPCSFYFYWIKIKKEKIINCNIFPIKIIHSYSWLFIEKFKNPQHFFIKKEMIIKNPIFIKCNIKIYGIEIKFLIPNLKSYEISFSCHIEALISLDWYIFCSLNFRLFSDIIIKNFSNNSKNLF
jgi:hypothetical protein